MRCPDASEGSDGIVPPVPRLEGGYLVTVPGWPIGFFENVVGALKDDPIERGDQGEYEIREPLD